MISFIKRIIPIDMEYEKRKQTKVDELKKLILAKIANIPASNTEMDVFESEQQSFGEDYKAAENHAISENAKTVPFYEEVCAALMEDKNFMAKMPKNSRLEVDELIERDKNLHYYTQLVVTLNWARKLQCKIL